MNPTATIREHYGASPLMATITGVGPADLLREAAEWLETLDESDTYVVGAHMDNEFDDDGELVWSFHLVVA